MNKKSIKREKIVDNKKEEFQKKKNAKKSGKEPVQPKQEEKCQAKCSQFDIELEKSIDVFVNFVTI